MVELLKKAINYLKNNGFISTFKAILRKLGIRFCKKKKNYNNYEIKLDKKEKDNITVKDGKKVYIFATVPYYDVGGGQRSSQMSKIFNKLGFMVSYIYAYESSENIKFHISMPLCEHKFIDNLSKEEFDKSIQKDDLVIFEMPAVKFEPFLKISKAKEAKVIYENIDNWETSLGNLLFSEKSLKLMLEEADMIVCTAKLLVEQTEKYFKKYKIKAKKVFYLPNAVDDELFEPRLEYKRPKDLIGSDIVLTYYGSLWGEWFDWDIIKKVAKRRPDISINLIGDYNPIKNKIKELPKNIHFLGLKKQTELPAYLIYSDFAILPFKPGDISDYVSPLKIFEYISMNKRVLSCQMPDIEGYPNVYTSNTAEGWIKIINESPEIDIEKREIFINENSWNNRCCTMLDILYPDNAKRVDEYFYSKISVVILNYNNLKVITKCVDTLVLNNERYNYEIIVVDNQSTDGSYEYLEKKYGEKIKLIRNSVNGCSSGRNLGVKNATGEYIVFMDSDQWVLNKYFLDNYLHIAKEFKEVGAVAWSAGWFNKAGYAYKYIGWYENKYMPPIALFRKDIGYLATCGFIIKKSLFEEIGGFDIAYDPTCYEDTDLSLSIRNAGYETVYSSYLGVGHLPHQTTKSGSDKWKDLIQQKGDYFVKKWKTKNSKLLSDYIKN